MTLIFSNLLKYSGNKPIGNPADGGHCLVAQDNYVCNSSKKIEGAIDLLVAGVNVRERMRKMSSTAGARHRHLFKLI